MSQRAKRLQGQVGAFVRQYGRKKHPGHDPNDRGYDRQVEALIKRMPAEELDALMHDDLDADKADGQASRGADGR